LPAGYGITETMLVPLGEAERAVVAPRLAADLSDAPPPRKGSAQTTGSGTRSLPQAPAPALSSPGIAAQTGPVAAAPAPLATPAGGVPAWNVPPAGPASGVPASAAPPRRSLAPWIAVGVFGALLGAGIGVARYANLLSPGAEPSAASSQPVTAPEARPRSVTVVILPPTARVEVEGKETPLSEGVLEITGAVGSVHKVRVVAGGAEKNVRVVVSDSGAVPPKIEVEGAAAPTGTAHTAAPSAPLTGPKPRPRPSATSDELRNTR
jgi:serine/threonine-protein kinase